MHDKVFQQKVIDLYLKGYSYNDLTSMFNISNASVSKVIRGKSGLSEQQIQERRTAAFRLKQEEECKIRDCPASE